MIGKEYIKAVYCHLAYLTYMQSVCVLVSQSCLTVCPQLFVGHRLWPTVLFCPWDSPGKNIGVGCHSLLQGIFQTQGLNPGLPHCRQTIYAEYIIWNAKLDEAQAGIKIVRRNINNLRYAYDATLMAESEEDFIFLGSKITVDGDCGHEIERSLLFGRKAWQT